MEFVRNQYGIEVKAWCVTCEKYTACTADKRVASKEAHSGLRRRCWAMGDKYARLGRSNGDNSEPRKLVQVKVVGAGKIRGIYK